MDKLSLVAQGRNELAAARRATSGRSAKTVYGGHEKVLRQTVIALNAGRSTDGHQNPGEATLQVLVGRLRLTTESTSWDGTPGDLIVVPQDRCQVHAVEDSAYLLTVAKLDT